MNPIQDLSARLMTEYAQRGAPPWFKLSIEPTKLMNGWWVLDLFCGENREECSHRVFVWQAGLSGIGATLIGTEHTFDPIHQYDSLLANVDEVVKWIWPGK